MQKIIWQSSDTERTLCWPEDAEWLLSKFADATDILKRTHRNGEAKLLQQARGRIARALVTGTPPPKRWSAAVRFVQEVLWAEAA